MGKWSNAFSAFFRVLSGEELVPKSEIPPPPPPEPAPAPVPDREVFEAGAVYALVLLQREGRLVDFLQEDISGANNDQLANAVRRIHAECRSVLSDRFGMAPVMSQDEQATVTVNQGFDPSAIKLTGNVPDAPPYRGRLIHRGWKADKVQFPDRSGEIDHTVVQPAEVEIG